MLTNIFEAKRGEVSEVWRLRNFVIWSFNKYYYDHPIKVSKSGAQNTQSTNMTCKQTAARKSEGNRMLGTDRIIILKWIRWILKKLDWLPLVEDRDTVINLQVP